MVESVCSCDAAEVCGCARCASVASGAGTSPVILVRRPEKVVDSSYARHPAFATEERGGIADTTLSTLTERKPFKACHWTVAAVGW